MSPVASRDMLYPDWGIFSTTGICETTPQTCSSERKEPSGLQAWRHNLTRTGQIWGMDQHTTPAFTWHSYVTSTLVHAMLPGFFHAARSAASLSAAATARTTNPEWVRIA